MTMDNNNTKRQLHVDYVDSSTLIPYGNNAKKHSDKQITQIALSIKEFGFNSPILTDGDNGIIAGHARLQAAQKLGLSEVPRVSLQHLSDAQKKAYILADNRLGEFGTEWDFELLGRELESLEALDFDFTLTGFGAEDLEKFIDFKVDEIETEETKQEHDKRCPHCGMEL